MAYHINHTGWMLSASTEFTAVWVNCVTADSIIWTEIWHHSIQTRHAHIQVHPTESCQPTWRMPCSWWLIFPDDDWWRLRSSSISILAVPPTRLRTIGDRAFPIAAARTWNSLPPDEMSSRTLSSLKSQLKTYLFSISSSPGLWYTIVLTVKWLPCFGTIHLKLYVCIYCKWVCNVCCVTSKWAVLCCLLCLKGDRGTIQKGEIAAANGQKQVSSSRRSVSCSILVSCQVVPSFMY